MKVCHQESVAFKVLNKIREIKSDVILRSDISSLGKYRQISRAMNKLINDHVIVRIGYGVYSKARVSKITKKAYPCQSLEILGKEALTKLKVKWDIGQAEQDYNAGYSTQVPVKPSLIIENPKFSRKIRWGNMEIRYERAHN